ncbi:MAG: 3-hydroxyisobutyrate dehydrogenase [Alphaproteobacteria bacterium]
MMPMTSTEGLSVMSDLTAFIGTGRMGGPMARNLARKANGLGRRIRVFDKSEAAAAECRDAGADVADNLTACMDGADVIFSMVPAGPDVRALYMDAGGVFDTAPAGALLVDCSTIDVVTAQEVAAEARKRGFRMVDAPVSGGVAGAEAATITFMVGGDVEDLETVRPQLEAMGSRVVHCGPSGMGEAAKICNNMLAGINSVAVAESYAIGQGLGLDPKVLYDVVSTSSGQTFIGLKSPPVKGLAETSAVERDFQPGFTVALMLKDLRLAQAAAKQVNQASPIGAAAAEIFAMAAGAGLAQLDSSAVYKLIAGMGEED